MLEDELIPVQRSWFWIGATISVVLLTICGFAVVFCEPLLRASAAATRLQARGVRMDFSESRLSTEFRQMWRQLSSRKLAMTAAAVYCPTGSECQVRDDDLVHVRAFPDLTSVDLRDQVITSAGLKHLRGLNLEALCLARTQVGASPGGLVPLESLHKLRMLDLSRTKVTDDDLQSLSRLHDLRGLNLADTNVTSAGIAHLSGLIGLVSLNLDRTPVSDHIFKELAAMRTLSHLDLVGTQVTGAGSEQLARCGLKELRLNGSALSDEGLRGIGQISTLSGLNISGTLVSPRGISHLAGLPDLRWLNMQGPRFGDDHLSAITTCVGLRDLKISGSQVTRRGIQCLASLKELASLEMDAELLKHAEVLELLAAQPKLRSLDVRLGPLTDLDLDLVQLQLGPLVRLFEVYDNHDKPGIPTLSAR